MSKPRNYYQAIAVMIGYVIGMGMFSLPFLLYRGGLLAFFIFFVFIAWVHYFVHLIYATVIISTKTYHRLPGYAGIYLGKFGKIMVFWAKILGNYGALLACLIITGIFANQLLGPFFGGNEFTYTTILFIFGSLTVYLGVGVIARAELFMSLLLFLVVGLIGLKGAGSIDSANYQLADWRYFLPMYGVMLFALDGNSALPIVVKLLNKDQAAVKKALLIGGSIIPIIIIAAFTILITGITGAQTTPDSLVGLNQVLGNGVVTVALAFGVLSMITSYLLIVEAIKETLCWDFNIRESLSLALAVIIPYSLFVLGFTNLIKVLSFAGGVAGGLSVILLLMIYLKIKKKENCPSLFKRCPHNYLIYALMFLFASGMIYEIYYFLSH